MNNSLIYKVSQINQVVLECMGASSEKQIIKKFTDLAVKILKADYGYAFVWDKKTNNFQLFYKDSKTPFVSQTPRKHGIQASVFKSKQPQYIPHTGKHGNVRQDARRHMKGVVIIPIHYGKNRYGTLDVCFYKTHKFTPEEKNLCIYIGNSAAQAITINHLYSDMEERIIERTWELEKSRAEISIEKAKDEAMLKSIGEGIVVTDTTGCIVVMNESAEYILNLPAREAVGKKWSEITDARDEQGEAIPFEKRPIHDALSGKKKTATHYYVRHDGSKFVAQVTNSPVLLGGQIIGAVLVIRDITHEKEIDRAKTEFVSLASHQLRTPLSAINWYTEALISKELGQLNNKQKLYAQEIMRSNTRMVELVNDLLNVSRIELGTFTLAIKPVNIVETAEATLKELESLITKKTITLKTSYKDISTMQTDPQLIRMVFQNLLSNAVKYTPPKGCIELTVGVESSQHPTPGLLITVGDSGYGIPRAQQSKIFTKLFRADNIKGKDPDGTGLGLYIIKSMLSYCGGDIWFESRENKGSKFSVYIPFNEERESAPQSKRL